MHRFFVPPEVLRDRAPGDIIPLPKDITRQLGRVLRARPGEQIELLDDSGWACQAEITALTGREGTVRLLDRSLPDVEPRLRLTLYQALPKHRKFDWILQKGTELGAAAFVPLVTRFSDVRPEERTSAGKVARWQRIVTEAAEQSGRTRLPQVLPVAGFDEACLPPPAGVLALMPYEGEQQLSLEEALRPWHGAPPHEVRLIIGPEGGFAPEEVALARQQGLALVSLGPRILRVETAALAALAIVLYALGEGSARP
ncbi:MAG: 16S rRNA (uracil(1498)-N(3))-methyltransferase [Chloroflexi bacterium]|nr:16S rRNA (uracil(1498)-N(3))-methyltransferase [Chloroflexota bacterium]